MSARHCGYSDLEFKEEVKAGDKMFGSFSIKMIYKPMGTEAVP